MSTQTVSDIYRLDVAAICQLLADPEFYRACPTFEFLMERGQQAVRDWLNRSGQGSISYEEAAAELQLVVASFVQHVLMLHRLDITRLRPLRNYIEECLEYSPERIVVAGRESGEQVVVEF